MLSDTDRGAVDAVLDADPLGSILVSSRVAVHGIDPWRLGAEIWGFGSARELTGVCYAGANIVPVTEHRDAVEAFAGRALRQGRRCSSIVGREERVLHLWSLLREHWESPREIRAGQPLLVAAGPAPIEPDPRVRPARPDEVDVVFPAAVAMFTEEVGTSPMGSDGGRTYHARLRELIGDGRVLVIIEDGQVVFKADLAAVSRHACQIQGVWVDPSLRGHGVATRAMAAVVARALTVAPVATLYVNAYNVPARRVYDRVGFRQVGTYASVLF